ncbi:protoheme IX farnesyltransferase [Mariniphaga sediminis]|uniref:heme o synthase n=2 Tax=Mariniphaga sediminis TaxID=1628158 RepID=A0A399D0L3_9BACT|nr:protoheme IX farnesyltransferase [Mariniphaga sediminis]
MKVYLKIFFEMGKVRISLPVALSALAGFALYSGELNGQGWWMAMGVFLMSCGSGAMNHWQERKTDALMPRTKLRPIPSGKVSSLQGALVVLLYLASGSLVLVFTNPPIALILSWLTLFFYNLVYTPLKKVSAFAVIPGSMVGALPPVIGWTAAGGEPFAETILIVGTFFFIGQIPHFWLLLMLFGDQYKLAGLPSLNSIFSEVQIKRVTYTWILTTVASALLVLFFVFSNRILLFLLLGYSVYLLISLTRSVLFQKDFKVRPAFFKLNFLYLFMMLFLIADSLLR